MTYVRDTDPARRPVTLNTLARMRTAGEPIAMLTCYDSTFAAVCDAVGADVLLVGDSLGNVLQGHDTTLPVTIDEMAYHVQCVARGNRFSWIVGDLLTVRPTEGEAAPRPWAAVMNGRSADRSVWWSVGFTRHYTVALRAPRPVAGTWLALIDALD